MAWDTVRLLARFEQIAESGAEVTSLSQESPAHPASLRDVLNALQECGMRFADVRAVARWL